MRPAVHGLTICITLIGLYGCGGFPQADLSNDNGPALVRPAVIGSVCCLTARACISAASCPHALLLPNADGTVGVRPAVLGLTLSTMVMGLYDYDRISLN